MPFVFGGIAIILGNILHDYLAFDEEGAVFGIMAIFLGAAGMSVNPGGRLSCRR